MTKTPQKKKVHPYVLSYSVVCSLNGPKISGQSGIPQSRSPGGQKYFRQNATRLTSLSGNLRISRGDDNNIKQSLQLRTAVLLFVAWCTDARNKCSRLLY